MYVHIKSRQTDLIVFPFFCKEEYLTITKIGVNTFENYLP